MTRIKALLYNTVSGSAADWGLKVTDDGSNPSVDGLAAGDYEYVAIEVDTGTVTVENAIVTTIEQETAPSLVVIEVGEPYINAYSGGSTGTYSNTGTSDANITQINHQMQANGINVADDALASGGDVVTVIETAVASDGTISDPYTSDSITVEAEEEFTAAAWHSIADSALYSDTAGTTPASVGGPVSRVEDLSGNGHDMVLRSGETPPILRESSGKRWLETYGDSSFELENDDGFLGSANGAALFIAVRQEDQTANDVTAAAVWQQSFGQSRLDLRFDSGVPRAGGRGGDTDLTTIYHDTALPNDTVLAAVADYAGDSTLTLRVDGTEVGSDTLGATGPAQSGGAGTFMLRTVGRFYGTFFYDTLPDATETTDVEDKLTGLMPEVVLEPYDPGPIPEATLSNYSTLNDDPAYTGMTATLASSVEGGQDENSKWLLRFAGPDDTIQIDGFSVPSEVDANGRTIHGCMINPFMGQFAQEADQGFDSLIRGDRYNGLLNVDPGHTGDPIVINAADYPNGCTIKKALSRPGTPGAQDGDLFEDFFEITIVPHDAVVPDGFYCPVHRQHDKRDILSYHNLNMARLPSMDISGTGVDTTPIRKTVWQHSIAGNEQHRDYGIYDGGSNYGRETHNYLKNPFISLMSDSLTEEEKRDHLRWVVPMGIEALYACKDEMENGNKTGFWGNGGHMQGRFEPATLVTMLTGRQDFIDIVSPDPVAPDGSKVRSGWHEKDQAWVVSDGTLTDYMGHNWPINDVGRVVTGVRTTVPLYYQEGHVGMPEWGEQHPGEDWKDNPSIAAHYRVQNMGNNAQTFPLLAAIGAIDVVGYEPMWALQDRFHRTMRGEADGTWAEENSVLLSDWPDLQPSLGIIDLWPTVNAMIGRQMWEGQPEGVHIGGLTDAGANTIQVGINDYVQMNGGELDSFDVAIIPRLPGADTSVRWAAWELDGLKHKAILVEGLDWTRDENGNYVVTVSDPRLGAGQEWEVWARSRSTNGQVGPFYEVPDYWSLLRITLASGDGIPVLWEDPAVEFPALQGIGETVTGTSDGVWTGYPTPTFSYRWERTNNDGDTVETISGATGADYTYVEGDVGYKLRRVVISTNSAGSTEFAGEWSPQAVEADPVTFIDTENAYLNLGYNEPARPGTITQEMHGFTEVAGRSFAVVIFDMGDRSGHTIAVGDQTFPVIRSSVANDTAALILCDIDPSNTGTDFVFSDSEVNGGWVIYPLGGPAEVVEGGFKNTEGEGYNIVNHYVNTEWGGGVIACGFSRFVPVSIATLNNFTVRHESSDSSNNEHSIVVADIASTRDGSESIRIDYGKNVQRMGFAVALKPAA